MEHLLDDAEELGRLLRLLKQLLSTLETYGLDVERDPMRLAEVLSAYRALEKAFKEHAACLARGIYVFEYVDVHNIYC